MAQEITIQELNAVFQAVFRDNSLEVDLNWSADNIEAWDSITHMRLIAEVESAFSVEFSYLEVMKMNTIGDLLKLINKHK